MSVCLDSIRNTNNKIVSIFLAETRLGDTTGEGAVMSFASNKFYVLFLATLVFATVGANAFIGMNRL